MPYTNIRASLTVRTQDAPQARELLESAIDQLAVRNIPVEGISVTEACADNPADADGAEGPSTPIRKKEPIGTGMDFPHEERRRKPHV